MALFIGLMSGTSLDGVDAVLARFAAESATGQQILGHAHTAFPAELRAELLALNSAGANELHRAALATTELVRVYATTVQRLLADAGVAASQVQALGAHGQTVRHQPQAFGGPGYTLQLMNGALLAELTGIDTVCDFRTRDVAAGGEGAPLVPAFHAACFADPAVDVAVVNLGGIANLTLLPAHGPVSGFDCGPGNALLDAWCQQHRGQAFDDAGRWAASGSVNPALLASWLAEPFFTRAPPKSTGRDLFSERWMQTGLQCLAAAPVAVDVMATLAELTVRGVADAVAALAPSTRSLLVCGGGAFNTHLMTRLAATLPQAQVRSTAHAGMAPDQVEALAFAWLARRFMARQAGNLPAVTGAAGARVLGALYPAA
ncbi:MAG: anhydro-N-acetylmuramic acid kinase [Rubrivivax sp.]|nr:anhydro-N-acetylmuramic acid kinase [Rubrivivax sp.]MDP3085531.1 anhydro-N-acetylmuramic acid kinase [Rubrivivax sp.]